MPLPAIVVLSSLQENCEQLCQWLMPLGRECISLKDVDELWALLWRAHLEQPGLLVLDGHPAEDTYPLINRLQNTQAGKQLPVLLLTDNLSDSSQRFYTELLYGVERLPKPLQPEMLRAKAADCLRLDDTRRFIEAGAIDPDWKQALHECLLAIATDGSLVYANRQAARWLRLSPVALSQLNMQSLMEAPTRNLLPSWAESPLVQAAHHQEPALRQFWLWRGDGGSLLVEAMLMPFESLCCLMAFRPLDAEDSSRRNLSEFAHVDVLTGLPTWPYLQEVVASFIREGQRPALLVLDIDHLRHVNEALGHEIGDHLLREVAIRLRRTREPGFLTALGGGRFALLMNEVVDFRITARVAQRLQTQFTLPFLLAGHEVFCSISIGIALCAAAGEEPAQLLKGAERALERAKSIGSNAIQFDSTELNRFSMERIEREAAFRRALDEGVLRVGWRQWRDAEGRVLAMQPRAVWPSASGDEADVAALAEDYGLSRELNDWLFGQAATSPDLPSLLPTGVSLVFEMSRSQLLDPFVAQRLRAWIDRHEITPAQIHLFLPWGRDEALMLAHRVPELVEAGLRLSLYLNGYGGSVLDASVAGPWQVMVLGPDYVRRFPSSRAAAILAAISGFCRCMSWQVYVDGLPPGLTMAAAYTAGITACSTEVELLPDCAS